MTSAQMTESERRKDRTEKLDLYQRAVDDRNNYCGVLNECIKTLETIVRLHRESDLHVTGPPDRRVLGVDIILPSHDELVSVLESCLQATEAEQRSRAEAARAGVDRKNLEKIGACR